MTEAASWSYSPDTINLYRQIRPEIASFYQPWKEAYNSLALSIDLINPSVSGNIWQIPQLLENATYLPQKTIPRKKFFIIIGPEGVGKTEIRKFLTNHHLPFLPNLTTRTPRTNEEKKELLDSFVNDERIEKEAQSNQLLSRRLHPEGYTTAFPLHPFRDFVEAGKPFIIEKSVNSYQQLLEALRSYPELLINFNKLCQPIFLLPPAPHLLALRIIKRVRNQDPAAGSAKIVEEIERSLRGSGQLLKSHEIENIIYLKSTTPDISAEKILNLL